MVGGLCVGSVQAQERAQALEERKDVRKQAPLSLRLTDEVISKAVRETLAESRTRPTPLSGQVLSADPYEKFSRDFSEARKPGCFGPDATKFQPSGTVVKTPLGAFNVGVGGLLALPFWAAAIACGKCN